MLLGRYELKYISFKRLILMKQHFIYIKKYILDNLSVAEIKHLNWIIDRFCDVHRESNDSKNRPAGLLFALGSTDDSKPLFIYIVINKATKYSNIPSYTLYKLHMYSTLNPHRVRNCLRHCSQSLLFFTLSPLFFLHVKALAPTIVQLFLIHSYT